MRITEADFARNIIEGEVRERPPAEVVVAPSLAEAARQAAAHTVECLRAAVKERRVAHLALTGGSGGIALAEALVPEFSALPAKVLKAIHLWFGDERFVPAGDEQRNDLLAAPLIAAGIHESRVHRLASPEQVADLAAATVLMNRELTKYGLHEGAFDVVHLGLGPDAHICSLFPGHPAALNLWKPAVAVEDSPKSPPQRYSLGFTVLLHVRNIMVIAGGAAKAQAVSAGLGAPDVVNAPASCARGLATTWYLDADAATGIPA